MSKSYKNQLHIKPGNRYEIHFEGKKGEEVYLRFILTMQKDLVMKEISRDEAHRLMVEYDDQELQESPKPRWSVKLRYYYKRFQKQKAD